MEVVDELVNIGSKLKKLRLEKALTQSQVAQRIGVTTAMVSSYELGSRLPSYEKLIKLAALYDVSTDYLLGLVTPKIPGMDQLTDHQLNILQEIVEQFIARE